MTQEKAGTGVISNGKRTSGVRKTWLTLLITFFLGFPTAGLLFFWHFTHATISRVGGEFAVEALAEMQGEGGFQFLHDKATLSLRENLAEDSFAAWKSEHADTKWELEPGRSYVEEINGRACQVAEFTVSPVGAEAGSHSYHMSVLRVTVLSDRERGPEWRIQRFEPAESPKQLAD